MIYLKNKKSFIKEIQLFVNLVKRYLINTLKLLKN